MPRSSSQRRGLVLTLLCAGLVALTSVAVAAPKKGVKVRVSPGGTIQLHQAVRVSWRTDVSLGPDEAYQATFAGGGAVEWAPPCVQRRVRIVGRETSRGSVVTLRFTPRFDDGTLSAWCETSSASFVYVSRVTLGADGKPDPAVRPTRANVGQAGPLKLACCTGAPVAGD